MRVFALLSVVLAAGFVVAGGDEDLKMAGKWRLQSYTKDGKATPQAVVDTTRTVVEPDGTYTVRRDGQIAVKAKLKLDSSKNPKQTDVTYTKASSRGRPCSCNDPQANS
jgi:uncharacterized protein (TIGR03067 family)